MGNILIVDDEKDIRHLIGDILADEGHNTRLAANSTECISEINKSPPDLLILDIWLKDSNMDGIDILKVAQRDNPSVPVVIISGHGNIEIAVAAKVMSHEATEAAIVLREVTLQQEAGSHPSIVGVIGCFHHEDSAWLLLELDRQCP